MYSISDAEKKVAMATSRNRGAVGANAVVPKLVREWASTADSILDFGCGKDRAHVRNLIEDGYYVQGYDFHLPASSKYLGRQFDIVYLSNVLNVQDSQDMLRETLRQAWNCVAPGGLLICNLPTSPRKGAYEGLTIAQGNKALWHVLAMLPGAYTNDNLFTMPVRIGGTSQAPVFKLQKEY